MICKIVTFGNKIRKKKFFYSLESLTQTAGAVEYTDFISAEEYDFPNKFPRYDTKQSDSEASVMLERWGMWSTPSLSFFSGPL